MKKVLLLGFAAMLGTIAMAQRSGKELKGDKYFLKYSFENAIEKYAAVDNLSFIGKRNLAESYKNTNQWGLSEQVYASFVNGNEATTEDVFNYASVLRSNGKYGESDSWMSKLQAKAPNDTRAKNFVNNASELSSLQKDEGRYKITHLAVNTESQDFGTNYYKDKVVFASSREGTKSIRRNHNWNGLPFLDLYVVNKDTDQLTPPEQFSKRLNNKMHEGPASFTKDGNLIAFTCNNYKGKSEDGTVKLKIFFSEMVEGDWGKETPFKLNNDEYSVGHPWLSQDGSTMYFSSDMPGGKGGVDIYKIHKTDGSWGEPQNITGINTEGNELFPFYQEDEELLFFSSNGHLGLGGLDVFVSEDTGDGIYTKILNVGVPLNSRWDDFGLIVDESMKKGYFSSNRDGGKGNDDIYSFELLKPFTFGVILKGTVKDKEGNILPGTIVNLYDTSGSVVDSITTGDDGAYTFNVERDQDYSIGGKKDKYFDGANTTTSKTDKDEVIIDLELEKDPGLSLYALITDKKTGEPLENVSIKLVDNFTGSKKLFTTGDIGGFRSPLADKKLQDRGSYNLELSKEGYFPKTFTYNILFDKEGQYDVHAGLVGGLSLAPEVKDIKDLVQINDINFDLNKYKIRPDAAIELDKIVSVMNEYPNMVVELGAHTDCRGSKKYNESLSDKRAKASAAYIKKNIVKPERIYGKGYGESRLLNNCACEGRLKSDCDEDTHATNRRTEFRIISVGKDGVEVQSGSTDSFDK